MQDQITEKIFTIGDGENKKTFAFNLNVAALLQKEFGTLNKWVALLSDQPKTDEDGEPIQAKNAKGELLYFDEEGQPTTTETEKPAYIMARNGEPDMEAFIRGFTYMLNEGVDIENDDKPADQQQAPYTEKQVGRLISRWGQKQVADAMKNAVTSANDTGETSPKE